MEERKGGIAKGGIAYRSGRKVVTDMRNSPPCSLGWGSCSTGLFRDCSPILYVYADSGGDPDQRWIVTDGRKMSDDMARLSRDSVKHQRRESL